MYSLKVANAAGEELILTGQENNYQVLNVIGLSPPKATINTSVVVGLDGVLFNSSRLDSRNIVLTVKINGGVEKNRLKLYNFFQSKEKCTLFFQNESLNVFIEGYVDAFECELFSQSEIAQISILCPFPYFKSVYEESAESNPALAQFVFPFSINENEPIAFSELVGGSEIMVYNASQSSTGVDVTAVFNEDTTSFAIKNTTTNQALQLNYEFIENDTILIVTERGRKSLKLLRNGAQYNLFGALTPGSTFFQLVPGQNRIEYTVSGLPDVGRRVNLKIKHFTLYKGV